MTTGARFSIKATSVMGRFRSQMANTRSAEKATTTFREDVLGSVGVWTYQQTPNIAP